MQVNISKVWLHGRAAYLLLKLCRRGGSYQRKLSEYSQCLLTLALQRPFPTRNILPHLSA